MFCVILLMTNLQTVVRSLLPHAGHPRLRRLRRIRRLQRDHRHGQLQQGIVGGGRRYRCRARCCCTDRRMLNRSFAFATERGTAAVAATAAVHVREDAGGAGHVAAAAAATHWRAFQGVCGGPRKCGRRRGAGIGTSTVMVMALLAVLAAGTGLCRCGGTVGSWPIGDDVGLVDGIVGVGVHRARACA